METTYRRGIFITFIVTFVLLVATIVIWKLKFFDDVTNNITNTQKDLEAAQATGNNLPKALKDEAIAKEQLALANNQLDYFRERFRSLNFDSSTPGKLNRTWQGYMNEYFSDYGLEMRKVLTSAALETGVNLKTSLKVTTPPQLPEQVAAPPSGFLKPVSSGTMTVELTGSFANTMRFLERINQAPILMTVGAIKIEGSAPDLKSTFTITPYLVAKGPDVKLPAAAAPAPAADAATAPATPGPGATPAP